MTVEKLYSWKVPECREDREQRRTDKWNKLSVMWEGKFSFMLSAELHDQMYKGGFNVWNQSLLLVDKLIIEGKGHGRRDEIILLIMKVIPLLIYTCWTSLNCCSRSENLMPNEQAHIWPLQIHNQLWDELVIEIKAALMHACLCLRVWKTS